MGRFASFVVSGAASIKKAMICLAVVVLSFHVQAVDWMHAVIEK